MPNTGMRVWETKATTSSTIPVGPVFDKREVRIRLGGGCGHKEMILLSIQAGKGLIKLPG